MRVQTDAITDHQTGGNLFLNNASNLVPLTSRPTTPVQGVNTVQVAAQGLTFNVTDTAPTTCSTCATTGANFSFSGDRTLNIGNIDTGRPPASMTASGAGNNLVNLSPTSRRQAIPVSLFATGQIGAGSADKISTTTSELT